MSSSVERMSYSTIRTVWYSKNSEEYDAIRALVFTRVYTEHFSFSSSRGNKLHVLLYT